MKFDLGHIYFTQVANSLIAENAINVLRLLSRHGMGDWGDCCDEDKKTNDWAVNEDARVFSVYDTIAGRLWIITEADRSSTTVLTPAEY